MKLFICYYGDENIGLRSEEFEIQCPFNKKDVEEKDLKYFRELQENVFGEFLDLKVKGIYDYEFKDKY